jgi:opacity protein-like surface antigen
MVVQALLPLAQVRPLDGSDSIGGRTMLVKYVVYGALIIGLIGLTPVAGAAQERSPHRGSTAVGVDVGMFVPKDDSLDAAPILGALFEYYLTPRVSVRTDFSFADPSYPGNNSLRQVPLRADLNYNWEGGRWHPFVGTGVGAYFLQRRNNGQAFGGQETKFGFNVGGGAEYFFTRRAAIKGEGRYHIVEDTTSGFDPSGLGLTIGIKTYF